MLILATKITRNTNALHWRLWANEDSGNGVGSTGTGDGTFMGKESGAAEELEVLWCLRHR